MNYLSHFVFSTIFMLGKNDCLLCIYFENSHWSVPLRVDPRRELLRERLVVSENSTITLCITTLGHRERCYLLLEHLSNDGSSEDIPLLQQASRVDISRGQMSSLFFKVSRDTYVVLEELWVHSSHKMNSKHQLVALGRTEDTRLNLQDAFRLSCSAVAPTYSRLNPK